VCDTVAQGYLTSQAWSFLFVCGEITSGLDRVRAVCFDRSLLFRGGGASNQPSDDHRARRREAGWTNYSLFLREDGMLIGYCETDRLEEVFHLD
jgi:hypothetical protein